MKKTVQKAASLLLSLLFLLALVPTASAVEPCNHVWHHTQSFFQYATMLSSTQCRVHYEERRLCKNCPATEYVRDYDSIESHSFNTYSANCDGRTQTFNMSCNKCHYSTQRTQRCPNAPHKGECTALPLFVGPELSIQ